MRRRIEQAALGELALDFHQHLAELAQQSDACGLIVNEGAAAPVDGEHAPQHEDAVALALEPMLCNSRAGWMLGRQRKDRGHHRLLGALTHQPALGAHAQSEAQSVQQDRLPGTGLSGQHAEPRVEPEFQPVDQHDIANGEALQHGRG